jgi:hypothetical protein
MPDPSYPVPYPYDLFWWHDGRMREIPPIVTPLAAQQRPANFRSLTKKTSSDDRPKQT